MYISDPTLDDLLRHVFENLLKTKNHVKTTRGDTKELTGALLHLTDPRARLSHSDTKGKLFSCLGELLWYLAKTDSLAFIRYYLKEYEKESEDGQTIYGAYGPRMFGMRDEDQIANVVRLLKERPNSRRAVIQLFNAEDVASDHKEIPCTCSLQFLLRGGHLEMAVCMRSNDAFIGLPHDVFAFTMLQEIMARTLDVELGMYRQFVGSLHLYEKNVRVARQYLNEGWQATESVAMPPMPRGDPWSSIRTVLEAERAIREGETIMTNDLKLAPYWADLVRLLEAFGHSGNEKQISRIRGCMSSSIYSTYLSQRETAKPPRRTPAQQPLLPFSRVAKIEHNTQAG